MFLLNSHVTTSSLSLSLAVVFSLLYHFVIFLGMDTLYLRKHQLWCSEKEMIKFVASSPAIISLFSLLDFPPRTVSKMAALIGNVNKGYGCITNFSYTLQ
jgi:hypothetical protein